MLCWHNFELVFYHSTFKLEINANIEIYKHKPVLIFRKFVHQKVLMEKSPLIYMYKIIFLKVLGK